MTTTTLAAIATFLKADHGPTIHRYARIAGTVLAFAITVAIIAAEAAYDLGAQTREAIDARNDQLAAAARAMVEWTDGIAFEFPEIVFSSEAPTLATLTVQELRRMARSAGHRALARNGRRAELLAALA